MSDAAAIVLEVRGWRARRLKDAKEALVLVKALSKSLRAACQSASALGKAVDAESTAFYKRLDRALGPEEDAEDEQSEVSVLSALESVVDSVSESADDLKEQASDPLRSLEGSIEELLKSVSDVK